VVSEHQAELCGEHQKSEKRRRTSINPWGGTSDSSWSRCSPATEVSFRPRVQYGRPLKGKRKGLNKVREKREKGERKGDEEIQLRK